MSAAQDEFEEALGQADRCIRKFSSAMSDTETVEMLRLCADVARELARAAERYSIAIRSGLIP